mmetsp:Transcript_10773/g.26382  ORF Transcript_10773/g.26382 Transcript_10773/m.26382 type:complete len:672 (+) Transcript_10773:79-2094(+)|eukprot:CAMPEP_0206246908 /NCGR_PEP_ID=MMETSP0047_2-20121206/19522_1 /ASSEMBLY_ACC=CAM_ASM_000192 /TAXON_ID=195065 /ORGANISM="Chroomonas mesostigmatica_cf, Strain CCMP1168" /LENGTH=671 /DNA_ID=CAMNT_0053672387 /DNA_START=35 /DNA_END=2050 /DNA_ORIENTATION=-
MSSQEIHLIVDRLREYKFEEDLTLVTFDEKTPTELLELLNNVLKNLSKDHDVDVRDEDPQDTAVRIVGFLGVLNYSVDVDFDTFKNGLQNGDPALIYPILAYLLNNLQSLRKRAYLARFLINVDVPEEMFADPEIQAKHQEYTQLQQQFKETHKSTERLRGTSTQPTELKREVAQLEEERQQLKAKITKMEHKLKKLDNFQELYEVTSTLRKEQEEEVRLMERMAEQTELFKMADQRAYQMRKKLMEMESAASDGTGEDLLRRLQEDVQMKTMMCMEKLPADIDTKSVRLEQVNKIIDSPPVTDYDIQEIQREIQHLGAEIQELQERESRNANQGGDKLSMFRQQALIVSRKKQDHLERLQMRQEEIRELETDLNEKREKMGTKGVKVLKGAEFVRYAEGLKLKAKQHKRLKGELNTIMAEKGILQRTEDILKTRHGDQTKFLEELERKQGVEGAAELQDKLEQVSEKTSSVNKAKEMTLEEISRVVSEINQTIKEKKAKLAPLIKELRQVRADFSQLEAEYSEKKSVYENTSVGLDADRDKLAVEVTAYQEECRREESRFHYLNAMIKSTNILLERAVNEDAGKNKIGEMGQSYRELYQSKIQQEENQSKILRERQKHVKESHERNLEQAKMFKSLHRLLGCKMKTLQAELESEGDGPAVGMGTNVMVMD